jgi:hypothetical protein
METEGIEEFVIDTAIDPVHASQPGRRLHVDHIVLDHQIAAFGQFDAQVLVNGGGSACQCAETAMIGGLIV